jgi:N-acetylmuramoyl-L-alanine amidase/putative methionine-R-sulfoxide reductase with GAF domain
MATVPTKPERESSDAFVPANAPAWPHAAGSVSAATADVATDPPPDMLAGRPTQRDALQVLLAFAALHEQVRRRKSLAARHSGIDSAPLPPEFEEGEQFVLDEVLQLVAERAVAITGADGLAIALAENNEIVLRAAAGTVRPDIGARIDRDSAFSGASFRASQVVICDDTETDPRVNLQACRRLGARSMVAVPLCGRRRVIGLLEAFSTWPFAFNDSDVRNLTLLAELVVGALKPEDEDRFAESAQAASAKLQTVAALPTPAQTALPVVHAPVIHPPVAVEPVASKSTPVQKTARPAVPAKEAVTSAAPAARSAVSQSTGKPIDKPEAEPVAAVKTRLQLPAVTTETRLHAAIEPESKLGKIQSKAARIGKFVLLIGIVLLTALAAGIWWKSRTRQLSGSILSGANTTSETSATAPNAQANVPSTPTNATPSTEQNQDLESESEESATGPATPDEIAKFPKITGIRHWSSSDSTTVVLDLEDQVQYEAHRLTGPDRIYVDLHDTQLAPELANKSIDIGESLLNKVRIAQPVAGMTRVVLETKANPNFSVSLEPNPYRLVIELRKIGAPPKGAVNLFPDAEAEKKLLAIVIPPPTKEDLQLRARVPKMRIVVDAGHGGWDLGTVGRRGLLEKDLVLEIAERLGKLLESRLGAQVIYTRQDDDYIPLDERAEIANQAKADLFVSVHANYSDLPSARGVETYYTNTFSAPGSKEAGAKDADSHSSIMAKGNGTLTLTATDLHERIEESRRLAASVQRALYGTLAVQNPGLRDRGVKEAGFVVLTESAMPGILAEVSFVSSPTDEQKLRSDGYREEIAEALYRGIARYAANSHNVKMAKK